MIQLHTYLSSSNIVEITSPKRSLAIRELLLHALGEEGEIPPKKHIKKLLRERALSHGILLDSSILLCHTRTNLVTNIHMNVGFCPHTAKFSKTPLDLIILILLPESMSHHYLSLMARLSRFLSGEKGQEAVKKQSPKELIAAVKSFDSDLV
ncbi:PTS sugar transporter subunit IIA [Chitinivibrio alkaliphilus]|uniref:PTS EIIA type-2 domain-containing protein n=1 Tax=Chitinivibrio alkaliphilus ACht1 TaxID=1313304 RepID=U7D361_9BACT|nr:PTS sugar transporter subunit IIA [Chitinivibrio alkaliphilus]ERP30939.1 hypothetical protein CALK_2188 [Chitinivibrio alkaliphilus ACht1]